MNLICKPPPLVPPMMDSQTVSYRHVMEAQKEYIWQQLKYITLGQAQKEWLNTIQNPCTKKSYASSMEALIKYQILDPGLSLQTFSLISPEKIIDYIKTHSILVNEVGEVASRKALVDRTREARVSCFLSFTRYLSRKTEGLIRRGIPSKEGIAKTFTTKPRKVKTEALTRSQMVRFFEELDKINKRDSLIAKICLHGAKRISEVLQLKTDQIDYEKRRIVFKQSKSKIADDFTIISFEKESANELLQQLKKYIGNRTGYVFVTAQGKPVQKTQVDRTFSKSGKRAKIHFRVVLII